MPMKIGRSELAKRAARAGGTALLSVVPDAGIIAKEGRGNFVTAGDLASEKAIMDLIRKYFPNDQILSEETASDITNLLEVPKLWVIDPIDGTWNFANHIPIWGSLIAVNKNGETIYAAMYFPLDDSFYWAEKGKGAFCNGSPLKISD